MPGSNELRIQLTNAEEFFQQLDDAFRAAIKQEGFTSTLRLLRKGRIPRSGMMTVCEGVLEAQPSGLYDAALQTDQGRVVLRGAQRTDRESADPQLISSGRDSLHTSVLADPPTSEQLVSQLAAAGENPPFSLICEVELSRFDAAQRELLLPLLWQYILNHRNSNDPEALVAVGAAIRKYIAIMPMDLMGDLAVLLDSGNRLPLPVELEIEVAKMIYRNFEVYPSVTPDPQPDLAQRLWDMVQAYTNPRILLRDKHSAAASLAIEAIVAMRSPIAERAWQAAIACPHRWFGELVNDDLERLRQLWSDKSTEAANWLAGLQKNLAVHV